jgi:hypothetical protein
MRRITFIMATLLIFSGSAWASDIVATWENHSGTSMQLSYRDDHHIRMDTSNDAYMLVSGDKVYMVTNQDGQWKALDMNKMAGIVHGYDHQAAKSIASSDIIRKLKNTGRTEKVAGYTGKVFLAQYKDDNGQMQQEEVVLSNAPDIIRINQGWAALYARMGQTMGQETYKAMQSTLKESQKAGYGGLLRYSDDFKLHSVKKTTLNDGYFLLPAGTAIIQTPLFFNNGAAPSNPEGKRSDEGDTNSPSNSVANETARDASQTTNENTVEAVRKGILGLFNQLK